MHSFCLLSGLSPIWHFLPTSCSAMFWPRFAAMTLPICPPTFWRTLFPSSSTTTHYNFFVMSSRSVLLLIGLVNVHTEESWLSITLNMCKERCPDTWNSFSGSFPQVGQLWWNTAFIEYKFVFINILISNDLNKM